MTGRFWIKLWTEMLDESKVARLSDRLWRRWVELLLLAKIGKDDGTLPPVREMAWRLRLSDEELESELVELARTGLIAQADGTWLIPKYGSRQALSPETERWRKWNENRKAKKAKPLPANKSVKGMPGFVYGIRSAGLVKLGMSRSAERPRSVLSGLPTEAEIIFVYPARDAGEAESALHHRYADSHVRGEWFSLTGPEIEELVDPTLAQTFVPTLDFGLPTAERESEEEEEIEEEDRGEEESDGLLLRLQEFGVQRAITFLKEHGADRCEDVLDACRYQGKNAAAFVAILRSGEEIPARFLNPERESVRQRYARGIS